MDFFFSWNFFFLSLWTTWRLQNYCFMLCSVLQVMCFFSSIERERDWVWVAVRSRVQFPSIRCTRPRCTKQRNSGISCTILWKKFTVGKWIGDGLAYSGGRKRSKLSGRDRPVTPSSHGEDVVHQTTCRCFWKDQSNKNVLLHSNKPFFCINPI